MAKCKQCKKKESDPKYKPFCSRRCADLDLGAWFNGDYAVPVVDNDMDFDDALEQANLLSEDADKRIH